MLEKNLPRNVWKLQIIDAARKNIIDGFGNSSINKFPNILIQRQEVLSILEKNQPRSVWKFDIIDTARKNIIDGFENSSINKFPNILI
jgi:predicted RNA binding protein with dsRBD fold (UPF0201 family)